MQIYEHAIQLLLESPQVEIWPELVNILDRAKDHRPVAWHFPVKSCESVGGLPEMAIPAVAAISCAHIGIILVDDILDEDPRGVYRKIGSGRAANLAIALNSLGIRVLMEKGECAHRDQAVAILNRMILQTAYGQSLDVTNQQSEEGYWAVTRAKSSPYFGAALFIGSLFGGGSMEVARKLWDFGCIYGEMMQIHDDLNDCLSWPANVDWVNGRAPLPILFAQSVDHPERMRFVELRGLIQNPEALSEAQSILVRSGAISYCVNELLGRHAQALQQLHQIELVKSEVLEQLLDEIIVPVQHLFNKVGAKLPEVKLGL